MQKRSHRLLARALLDNRRGFSARRYEAAFVFGSFQPDCNPFTYLKGSVRGHLLQGHHYANCHPFLYRRIARLQRREKWNLWHYYTLGKLTHYLADAFTYPHNDHYPESITRHHDYERELRLCLARRLPSSAPWRVQPPKDLVEGLEELHRRYVSAASDLGRDVSYILQATALLMAGCAPAGKGAA